MKKIAVCLGRTKHQERQQHQQKKENKKQQQKINDFFQI